MTDQTGANAASMVEAILLVSPQAVDIPTLSAATGFSETDVSTALDELEERYSPESSGVVLRKIAGGFQLATNPACAAAVERFRRESRPAPLSNAAHEVLACALYLGPLTRSVVSATRGVNSDAVVRSLLERGLLAEVGEDTGSAGSPALLDVTQEFLTAVGAASRKDFLPLDSLVGPEELARVRERLGTGGEAAESPEEGF